MATSPALSPSGNDSYCQPAAATATSPFPAPRWVKHNDRRLLDAPTADIVPDMVVAKDGSGTHQSIGDAVEAAPVHSARAES